MHDQELADNVSELQATVAMLPRSVDGPLLVGDIIHQLGEITHCHWMATSKGGEIWDAGLHTDEGRAEIKKRIARAMIRLLQLAEAQGVAMGPVVLMELLEMRRQK